MKWSEYRKEVSEYRKYMHPVNVLDAETTLVVNLLGIREKFDLFMVARKEEKVDRQIEEFGDMLLYVAELSNCLEDHFDVGSRRDLDILNDHVPYVCVSTVKRYLTTRDKEVFVSSCLSIASKCMLEYVCTITADDAMKVSLEKLKELRG